MLNHNKTKSWYGTIYMIHPLGCTDMHIKQPQDRIDITADYKSHTTVIQNYFKQFSFYTYQFGSSK